MLGWLFGRLTDKSQDITGVERTVRRVRTGGGTRASATAQSMRSFGDLEDFPTLRRHALGALCGALMDRHTDCEKEHPFCGPGHLRPGTPAGRRFPGATHRPGRAQHGHRREQPGRGLRQPGEGTE